MNSINKLYIFAIILCVGILIYNNYNYNNIKPVGPDIVKCYDSYNNEIIGLQCIEMSGPRDRMITFNVLGSLCLFVLILTLIINWSDPE